jgi:hypothetical protein
MRASSDALDRTLKKLKKKRRRHTSARRRSRNELRKKPRQLKSMLG